MMNKEDLIILQQYLSNKSQNLSLYFSNKNTDLINLDLLLEFLTKEKILLNKVQLQFDEKHNFSEKNIKDIINKIINYNNSIIIEINYFIKDINKNNVIFSNIKIDLSIQQDFDTLFSYPINYLFVLNSKNIEFWKNNCIKIIEKYNQYYKTPILHFQITQNLNWENIHFEIFQDFLTKIFYYYYEYYEKNNFIKNVLLNPDSIFYIQIPDKNFKNLTKYNCNLHNYITIQMNNLFIIPCYLFNQLQFIGGQIKNQEINLKEGFNGYMNLMLKNPLMNIDCNVCNYRYICSKTCPALNYIQTGDYNINQNEYCYLLKIKYNFLFNKLKEIDLFSYILNNNFYKDLKYNWFKEFLIGQAEKIL